MTFGHHYSGSLCRNKILACVRQQLNDKLARKGSDKFDKPRKRDALAGFRSFLRIFKHALAQTLEFVDFSKGTVSPEVMATVTDSAQFAYPSASSRIVSPSGDRIAYVRAGEIS